MFRSAHSLKGLSAMLGLKDINQLTHRVENVFDAARKDELRITGDVVELMFQALDRLVGQVQSLKDPGTDAAECESVIHGIAELLQHAGVERQQTSQADAERALGGVTAPAPAAAETPVAPPPAADPPVAEAPVDHAPAVEPPAAEIPAAEVSVTPAAAETPVAPTPVAPPQTQPPATPDDPFSGIHDESEIPDKYLSIFIDETELSLDHLTETLLAVESGGSREAIESLLVTAHRIKGSAASIGLNRAAKLAHLMEDQLQTLLDNGLKLSHEMTDAMLRATDALRQFVQGLRSGNKQYESFANAAAELIAVQPTVARVLAGAVPASASAPVPTEPSNIAPSANLADRIHVPEHVRRTAETAAQEQDEETVILGSAQFQPNLTLAGLKARLIYEKLCNLGEVCVFEIGRASCRERV